MPNDGVAMTVSSLSGSVSDTAGAADGAFLPLVDEVPARRGRLRVVSAPADVMASAPFEGAAEGSSEKAVTPMADTAAEAGGAMSGREMAIGVGDPVEKLARELARLPGMGPRNARRVAFHLLQEGVAAPLRLARALTDAVATVKTCIRCGNLGGAELCRICADPRRDATTVMVVAGVADLRAVEETGEYRGVYHVLGGVLSPLAGVGPERLRIAPLMARADLAKEIILALNPTVEGDSTALYLARDLRGRGPRLTRLATGVPMGGELEYQDRWTLTRALESRVEW